MKITLKRMHKRNSFSLFLLIHLAVSTYDFYVFIEGVMNLFRMFS